MISHGFADDLVKKKYGDCGFAVLLESHIPKRCRVRIYTEPPPKTNSLKKNRVLLEKEFEGDSWEETLTLAGVPMNDSTAFLNRLSNVSPITGKELRPKDADQLRVFLLAKKDDPPAGRVFTSKRPPKEKK